MVGKGIAEGQSHQPGGKGCRGWQKLLLSTVCPVSPVCASQCPDLEGMSAPAYLFAPLHHCSCLSVCPHLAPPLQLSPRNSYSLAPCLGLRCLDLGTSKRSRRTLTLLHSPGLSFQMPTCLLGIAEFDKCAPPPPSSLPCLALCPSEADLGREGRPRCRPCLCCTPLPSVPKTGLVLLKRFHCSVYLSDFKVIPNSARGCS